MLQAMFDRRSVRHYKNTPIPKETLDKILEAAMYAPTANNIQPWHFIVVDDRRMLEKIMQSHPYTRMLTTAPVAIIPCGDVSLSRDYWFEDCSAATQNILLAAREFGLGSCWCGVYPQKERMDSISSIFSLPGNIAPFAVIAIGEPDEDRERPIRFNPARVHFNKW